MTCLRLFLVLLIFPVCLFSQNNYTFQHLTTDDGLLSDRAQVFQDNEGYYWFAGIDGIQRFDGKNFITYKFNYNPAKLVKADDWVNTPVEDAEKNIWIVNAEGINIFYRKQQKLSRLYMNDAADSNSNNVASIINADGKLWIITNKNIYAYNYATNKPVLYRKVISNERSGIQNAQYDKQKNCFWLLIAGTEQIVCFNINSKQIIYPIKETADRLLGHEDQIPFFKIDRDENLWIANYIGDLCKYNLATGKATLYNILHERNNAIIGTPNSAIADAVDDNNGSIWFGGDYYLGVLKYNKKSGTFSEQQNDNGSEYGLHYNEKVFGFFQDKEKNIWIDTDLGMNIFNPQAQVFKYLTPQKGSFVTKFSADISSIYQSACGDVWVSTWGDGVFRYDSNFILRSHYIHDKKNASSFGEPLNRAWCFAEGNKGRIWIGCQHGMLSVFDTAKKQFINKVIPEFQGSTVMHAVKAKNRIWFGLYNGLIASLDESSYKIKVFTDAYKNPMKTVSSVDGICADATGNIWWSPGSNGIREFDAVKNVVVDSALIPLHISSPFFLSSALMVAGTDTKGLCILNKLTKSAKFFNTANGLTSNDVFGAVADRKNRLWIMANNGINMLNLSDKKISGFTASDGIRDHELQGAFYQLRNGTIMFAAKSGIVYFHPDSMKTKSIPPDVTITNFSSNEHNYSVDSLLQNKNIQLSYKQNVVAIEYASLSFSSRATTKYFYKLSGVDKDWVNAGTQRSVTYANLSPGSYIFNVRAQNNDGVDTKNITSLSIVINTPWWQSWWAYFLWFAIAIFIVFKIYDYRKRNREVLANIRQKIASDLHDDIGSTLNSISVYSEVATQQIQTNVENARSILNKMGNASRNMIDTMNDIVWSVNPKNDQFENILQRMKHFAGEILSGKNILLHFQADEKIKNIKLPMEKRKNFYLIFKEALNNACKYSRAKNVYVQITEDMGRLMMTIKDDGIGFDINEVYAGNGLKNMQDRAREMHARFNMVSEIKKGTQICLNMPVK